MKNFKKIWNYIVNNVFILFFALLAVIVVLFIVVLFFRFESAMSFIGVKPEEIKEIQWTVIKNVGYALGVLLLIIQISISHRRAVALEKTADATLKSGVEQRYHNAVSHLESEKLVVRIGAIYNLYHISQISQSTNTYDATIFDMFCAYLRNNDPVSEGSVQNVCSKAEKQIIIDKLFKVKEEERVLSNPKNTNLTGADLTGVSLTGADLTGAILTGTVLDACSFKKTTLTNAKLPADLTNIKSMTGAIIDGVNFSSGSDLRGLQLSKASWKNATVRFTDLSNANLSDTNLTNTDFTGSNFTGSNFTGSDVTFEQLSKVKCLYDIKGLDVKIYEKLKSEKPELFIALTGDKK